jgi:hypothetical protein
MSFGSDSQISRSISTDRRFSTAQPFVVVVVATKEQQFIVLFVVSGSQQLHQLVPSKYPPSNRMKKMSPYDNRILCASLWTMIVTVMMSLSKRTEAFVPAKNSLPSTASKPHHSLSITATSSSRLFILWDPRNVETDLVDFPTPAQRTELKKEAKRRSARKTMPLYFFPEEEMEGPWSPETFQDVWNLLVQHEMITLKGICRNDRKLVYQTAQWFCEEMEELISSASSREDDDDNSKDDDDMSLPVTVLSYQGHSALIYCPTLPLDHPDKFLLRTSVGQKNVYTARPKPLRDNRGQIIIHPPNKDDEFVEQ